MTDFYEEVLNEYDTYIVMYIGDDYNMCKLRKNLELIKDTFLKIKKYKGLILDFKDLNKYFNSEIIGFILLCLSEINSIYNTFGYCNVSIRNLKENFKQTLHDIHITSLMDIT